MRLARAGWRRSGGPAVATPAPDFLAPTRGTHRVVWLALANGLAALGVASVDAWQAWHERAEAAAFAEAAGARLERARSRRVANTAAAAAPMGAGAAPPLGARRDQAAAATDRNLLSYPWPEVFESIERSTPAGVQWLAMEHGTDGALRLEGQVRASDAAVATAEQLQRARDWQDVSLRRLERLVPAASAPAAVSLRFELQARRQASSTEGTR